MTRLPDPVPAATDPGPPPPVASSERVRGGGGVAGQVRQYARLADGESRAFVARQPLVAVAAGAAVGALLGWLVKR